MVKAKMSSKEVYEKVWTQEQRDAWQAVGAFIYQLRRDGLIKGKAS